MVWGTGNQRNHIRDTNLYQWGQLERYPFLQTKDRIEQLKKLGHDCDKFEFFIMGRTFISLNSEYRDYFIRNLHDALSGHCYKNHIEAVKYSE